MPQKFLIIQTAFTGDVVLATGILEKLHHFFPEAQIDFLVRKGNESLFSNHPFLNELMIWEKKEKKKRNLFNLLLKIRKRRYDKVINVQRFAATGFLTAFSGGKETIGFDKNPFSFLFKKKIPHEIGESAEGKHEIDRNNRLIAHFTDDTAFRPALYPSDEDEAPLKRFKRLPYICIAPGSVWFTKQYPVDKWIAFMDKVPYDYSIYLLGGPSERAIADQIKIRTANPYVINFVGELSYLQSASLMADAAMNYVNDSAPLHFASAMNAPVTAVYCSTIPAFGFGPLSDKKHIVEIPEPLYCRPCGLHGYMACPEGHFKCAWEIDKTQLLSTLPRVASLSNNGISL
jgi:heptosyltransferase-2